MELLDRLLSRGDLVALDSGKLIIDPASGGEVPASWLKDHSDALALTLATRANTPLYKHTSYTVGAYGKHKKNGVTLQFVSMATGEEVYVIFNVNRERVQGSPKGKAGTKLPGKQFRITENMALYKFWLRTGLAAPERKYLSEFNRVMGRLKSVYFTICVSDGKADKNTIQAASFTILARHENRGEVGENTGEKVGKSEGGKMGSGNPAKFSATGLADETSCVSEEVRIKLISKEVSKDASLSSTTDIQETLNTNQPFRYVPPHLQTNEEWLEEYDTGVRLTITCSDERWDQCT